MYDDDKSTDVQLICNLRVVTYNKLRGINQMGLIVPWANSLDIIALHPVEKFRGLTQWALMPLGPNLLR